MVYRKRHRRYPWFRVILFASVLILVISGFEFLLSKAERKPTIETNKSEVKKFPKKVIEHLKLVKPPQYFNVPILLYHYVEFVKDTKDTMRQSLNITPDIFEMQVKSLKEAGFTFITTHELGLVIDGQKKLPPKPLIITFDDGHWDILTDIVPILNKYNAKAVVYIITDFLDTPDFLSTAQLHEVIKSKRLEIGAHTVHHVSLSGKMPQTTKYEVAESKNYLEKKFNIWVDSFAYPNGALDLPAIKAVREAGYATAVSTVPGVEVSVVNRFALYRLRPGRRTGQELVDYLSREDSSYR